MQGDYVFNVLKMDSLAEQYSKEKDLAYSLNSQINKSKQIASPEKKYVYDDLLRKTTSLCELFSNMSLAVTETSYEMRKLLQTISNEIEDNIDYMRITKS